MIQKITFILFLIIALFSSCEVINPDEDVPAFVEIKSVGFSTDPGQGSDLVDIEDVWIYINNESIGAFQLPAKFPILKSGNQNMEIRFGILLNGIAATRSINPFFNYKTQNVKLIPGEVVEVKPATNYNSATKFVWNSIGQEGFEEGGISIDSVAGTSTKITKSTKDVFEGTYSGLIHLDQDHKKYIGQSSKKFELPSGGKPVVMEINCKNTNNHFAIGMFVEAADGKITIVNHMVVNPSPVWKKLYVNFTELVSNYSQAKSFRVFFTSQLESTNSSTDIYLDNIKLMHF